MNMEYIFIVIYIIQAAIFIYVDYHNRKERERLQLQIMSKSTEEFITAQAQVKAIHERPSKESPKKTEEDEMIELEDASEEDLLNAKDNL